MIVVVDPPAPFVTPADVSGEHAADDPTVEIMIAAATAEIDGPNGWLGRALGPQTLELRTDCFMQGGSVVIPLPYPPLIDVESVSYDASLGEPVTIDPASYGTLDGRALYPKPGFSWPAVVEGGSVRIRYRVGHDGQEGRGEVPANAKAAVIIMAKNLLSAVEEHGGLRSFTADGVFQRTFNSPELVQKARSTAVEALLAPLRVYA